MTRNKKNRPTKSKLTNRLVIMYGHPDLFFQVGNEQFRAATDSFKCMSKVKADLVLSKRNKKNIRFAKLYDNGGVETVLISNTRTR